MVPQEYQDMVLKQPAGQTDIDYKKVRDKAVSVAGNKAQTATPVPMDIGHVGRGDWFGHDAGDWFDGDEMKNLVRKSAVEER